MMVLGTYNRRVINFDNRARAGCASSRCGIAYLFSVCLERLEYLVNIPSFPWETSRCVLKYCLKEPL